MSKKSRLGSSRTHQGFGLALFRSCSRWVPPLLSRSRSF